MPFAHHGDIAIHWREEGEGEPLALIMGLGGSSAAWYRLLPHLRDRARVILIDNRGTGQSDRITERLTLGGMLGDVVAVLDDAGVERAHVLGVSMGGMIAQRLALEHRERVRSLVLAARPRTRAARRRGA